MANWNLQEAVSAWMDVHHPRNNPLAMRFVQVYHAEIFFCRLINTVCVFVKEHVLLQVVKHIKLHRSMLLLNLQYSVQ